MTLTKDHKLVGLTDVRVHMKKNTISRVPCTRHSQTRSHAYPPGIQIPFFRNIENIYSFSILQELYRSFESTRSDGDVPARAR
jgi:hypothetical protein